MHVSNSPYFIKSCGTLKQIPKFEIKSIGIVGRSNVGKSSLINALAKSKIAKTSKTPGCTRTLNFFNFYNKFILVDMPGYGYAKVPLTQRQRWDMFLHSYLDSEALSMCLILIDARVGFKITDVAMIELLVNLNVPYSIVFTKSDKIKSLPQDIPDIIQRGNIKLLQVSAHTGLGLKELYTYLNHLPK